MLSKQFSAYMGSIGTRVVGSDYHCQWVSTQEVTGRFPPDELWWCTQLALSYTRRRRWTMTVFSSLRNTSVCEWAVACCILLWVKLAASRLLLILHFCARRWQHQVRSVIATCIHWSWFLFVEPGSQQSWAQLSSASTAFSLVFFTECRYVAGLFVRHKHCTIPVLCISC